MSWRESLYAQVQRLGVYGVSCMGVGCLFDVPFQGQSTIIAPTKIVPGKDGILEEAKSATEEEVISAKLSFPPRANRSSARVGKLYAVEKDLREATARMSGRILPWTGTACGSPPSAKSVHGRS